MLCYTAVVYTAISQCCVCYVTLVRVVELECICVMLCYIAVSHSVMFITVEATSLQVSELQAELNTITTDFGETVTNLKMTKEV